MPNLLVKFNKFGMHFFAIVCYLLLSFAKRTYCCLSAIAFFTPSAKSWF